MQDNERNILAQVYSFILQRQEERKAAKKKTDVKGGEAATSTKSGETHIP